uniref:MATH domain-containing protein n=1 Tax=Graphocephala atropunctata TaxID=36148 RepID=A0A1B6L769_9HEMI
MEVDRNLPSHVKYWLTATSRNDCFFVLGSESDKTKRIGAIKIFLFGHSEPLRHMLENSELAEQGDVRVTDIEPETFWTFLTCVYGGTDIVLPKLSFKESVNLLYVLDKYLVTEIKPKVVSHSLEFLPLNLNNVFCALSNPVCFQDEVLAKEILKMIQSNGDKVLTSEHVLQLSAQSLLLIVKAECLNTSETNVWDAVVKWAKHTTKSNEGEVLRNQILSHLRFIRLCTFGSEDFCKKVVPTGIVTKEEVFEICNYFGTGIAPKLEYICNITAPRLQTKTEITINLVVDGLSNVFRNKSQTFIFDNYYWEFKLSQEGNHLSYRLLCKDTSKTSWNIPVAVKMALINQKLGVSIVKTFSATYSKGSNDWGDSQFCTWAQLVDVSNGFVKNNTIIALVNVKRQ